MLDKKFRETYHWTAFYSDSTILTQHNEDGTVNQYPDIDRSKLAAFGISVVSSPQAEYETSELLYRVFLEPGQNLIYRRRPSVDFASSMVRSELILIGTQQKVKGISVQNIAYIDVETGLIQVAGKWIGGAPNLIGVENGQ